LFFGSFVALQQFAAFRGDFACGGLGGGHRFTPSGGAECKPGRLTVFLDGRRLGLDALIARVEEQLDGYEPIGWRPSRSPARNDQIFLAPHAGGEPKMLWVDPVTGTISGSPVNSSETFTGWLLELHDTLFGGHAGILIAGVFAALLCVLGVSGEWIYRNFWRNLPPPLKAERAHFLLRLTQDGGDFLR
jgi:uncharacterized iron-regulated membrane protein